MAPDETPHPAANSFANRPSAPPPPKVSDEGGILAAAFEMPFSCFASAEARDAFVRRLRAPAQSITSIAQRRELTDRGLSGAFESYARRHPYTSVKTVIDSVPIETFVPQAGVAPCHQDRA